MKQAIKIATASFLTRVHRWHCEQVLFALGFFALCQMAHAVNPPPDGGYIGGNTAEGQNALFSLTTGTFNTALGFSSLQSNSTASFNTALGAGALLANTADENTAAGAGALLSNTTGRQNTANGAFTLVSNTTGNFNAAYGVHALFSNTDGHDDTAIGYFALYNNTIGNYNIGIGDFVLPANSTGNENTAIGYNALGSNTSGNGNVALGFEAGANVTTANNVICIGDAGANLNNSCFIGNIRDVATQFGDAVPVVIDSVGQLGTAISSRRFKHEIKPMSSSSEAILALKPVTFQYKSDRTHTPQFGLIAEEVAEVNPNLVVRDKSGKIYTVRYDAVNAMLLNEFLKEHRKVQELQNGMATLTAQLKQQAAQIQKVKAQVEMNKPATKVASLSAVALRGGGNNQ